MAQFATPRLRFQFHRLQTQPPPQPNLGLEGVLPEATVAALQDAVEADPATEIVVDLDNRVVLAEAAGIKAPFEIDNYTRWRLMEGLDDIGLTLRHADDITTFEATRPAFLPVTA